MEEFFTRKDLRGIFGDKYDNKTMEYHESKNHIPKSSKKKIGGLKNVSCWNLNQMPQIGQFYGNLNKPKEQITILIYMGKGGVLKTTLSYNYARNLALNGLKVLIIGLDTQVSITTLALEPEQYFDLNSFQECKGLDDYIRQGAPLKDIIKTTDLPGLEILPETSKLETLETSMKLQSPRDVFFKEKLLQDPYLQKYDVILFDGAPGFDVLTENALLASSHLIVPMSTEIGTVQVSVQNIKKVKSFQARNNKKFKSISIVPTLTTSTRLSRQILTSYEKMFGDEVIASSIRRSINAQESLLKKRSYVEYKYNTNLAQDFKNVIEETWNSRICPKVH